MALELDIPALFIFWLGACLLSDERMNGCGGPSGGGPGEDSSSIAATAHHKQVFPPHSAVIVFFP